MGRSPQAPSAWAREPAQGAARPARALPTSAAARGSAGHATRHAPTMVGARRPMAVRLGDLAELPDPAPPPGQEVHPGGAPHAPRPRPRGQPRGTVYPSTSRSSLR
eukprot:27671-Pyramimonas_sp.AAC.1